MEKSTKNAPGTCADCGDDAYIRLSGDNGSPEMLCAHCFIDRARLGKLVPVTRSGARDATQPQRFP
ncbi:MAG: hypothetical protein KGJ98_12470 [Chloroflexota bacterium]|nr:hypothetical protein [Chloroflexota bacterium]